MAKLISILCVSQEHNICAHWVGAGATRGRKWQPLLSSPQQTPSRNEGLCLPTRPYNKK